MHKKLEKIRKQIYELDCTKCAVPVLASPSLFTGETDERVKQEEKAMKMYNKDKRTEAQQAKDYLIRSLEQEMCRKEISLPEEFGLEVKRPKNLGELRQAEKEGWLRFNIPEEMKNDTRICSWMDYIEFSDPKVKTDEAGFHVAVKKVREDASGVKDQIVVMGPEAGLEALNEFKAKTYA